MDDTVFLFDVDNTLIDNDRVQADLDATSPSTARPRDRYWAIFEDGSPRWATPIISARWSATA